MVGIKHNSLADLNGQVLAWCNKVNGKVHATTNEIPFVRLKKESLSRLSREYIIDKINLRRVQKDCLIYYARILEKTTPEPSEAVPGWGGGTTERYELYPKGCGEWSEVCPGEVVNLQHYRRLTPKQTMDGSNVLLERGKVIDFPLKPSDLSRYDKVWYE